MTLILIASFASVGFVLATPGAVAQCEDGVVVWIDPTLQNGCNETGDLSERGYPDCRTPPGPGFDIGNRYVMVC